MSGLRPLVQGSRTLRQRQLLGIGAPRLAVAFDDDGIITAQNLKDGTMVIAAIGGPYDGRSAIVTQADVSHGPVTVFAPVVTGDMTLGTTAVVTEGVFAWHPDHGAPIVQTYWTFADGTAISGARGSEITVTEQMIAFGLTAHSTASNGAGTATVSIEALPQGLVETVVNGNGTASLSAYPSSYTAAVGPESGLMTFYAKINFMSYKAGRTITNAGGGFVWEISGSWKMSFVVRDTTGAIIYLTRMTKLPPSSSEGVAVYVGIDVAAKVFDLRIDGVSPAQNVVVDWPADTASRTIKKNETLSLLPNTMRINPADMFVQYGAKISHDDFANGPARVGSPQYQVGYPMRADADVFGDTQKGWNSRHNLGSGGTFDGGSQTFTDGDFT